MSGIVDLLRHVVATVMAVTAWPILTYFIVINTSFLVLIGLAALEFSRHMRRMPFADLEAVAASPLTLPVSVLVPAYNEEVGIVPAVQAMLALRYPQHEVVVVDDGSTDATAQVLIEAFDLVEVPIVVPQDVPTKGMPQTVHVPADGHTPLVLVRSTNGGRSSAINVGVNAARYPLMAIVDADSILDPDALLVVSKPFADDPQRVVATGGVIRAVNGCRVVAGRVVEVAMPHGWLARIQVVEYLRAFLIGRTGWSRAGALLIVSGAFGLFRRDVVVEVGGLDVDCIGEDFELVTKIHRRMRDEHRDYRVVFVSEPVSWTEVPPTRAVLASQRRRWHRGLWEVLWKHRRMALNGRYGRIGLIGLPYFWLFELIAPALEFFGVVIVPLGLVLGVVQATYAIMFATFAYGYAIFVSVAALLLEEYSFHRYPGWRDLAIAVAACVLENVGYRQLTAWWRLQGWWAALRGARQEWGTMTREGFGDAAGAGPGSSSPVNRTQVNA
jgi:cellulose synthase/poly-beta-1,6-N-acetylglucosamine synthase-like glycosyltransferase